MNVTLDISRNDDEVRDAIGALMSVYVVDEDPFPVTLIVDGRARVDGGDVEDALIVLEDL